MQLNTDEFLPDLEGLPLTIEQKREVIRTLYAIMEAAIDEAFGTNPVQLSQKENNLQSPPAALDSKGSALHLEFANSCNDETK